MPERRLHELPVEPRFSRRAWIARFGPEVAAAAWAANRRLHSRVRRSAPGYVSALRGLQRNEAILADLRRRGFCVRSDGRGMAHIALPPPLPRWSIDEGGEVGRALKYWGDFYSTV